MTQSVLVCGGAGYIGSHMVRMLAEAGHDVTVFDNLSTGHKAAVQAGTLVRGDLLDKDALAELFAANRFDAVFHFSGLIAVGESVREPARYYRKQRDWHPEPARRHACGRSRAFRLLVDGRRLRQSAGESHRRGPAAGPDQPLRADQTDHRGRAGRFRRRPRPAVGELSLFQRRRGPSRGRHRRGTRPGDPSDPQRPAGGPGHAARHRDLRRRLPDRRRDLRTRLRPCPGSVHGPSGGPRLDGDA